jgi:hypothetical protein
MKFFSMLTSFDTIKNCHYLKCSHSSAQGLEILANENVMSGVSEAEFAKVILACMTINGTAGVRP